MNESFISPKGKAVIVTGNYLIKKMNVFIELFEDVILDLVIKLQSI